MKILVVHNFYQRPGGEDVACHNEILLLRQHGHEVHEYFDDNHRVSQLSGLRVGLDTIWSRRSYERMASLLGKVQADIVHLHNTFPLISPSVYYVARKHGAAVVQTLHNFRILCSNAIFLRDGNVCEACLGKWAPLKGVLHKCYRNSRAASAGVAAMVGFHRMLRTWRNQVDIYVSLSRFARAKFVAGGLPPDKIAVKPNFLLRDPGLRVGPGEFALYVGRLSPEKGIATLLAAWERMGHVIPLKIAGDGPEALRVQEAAARVPGITWLGPQPHEQVLSLMKQAQFLMVPSLCYENFPLTITEAFGCGVPVIASGLGALKEIVQHDRTGLHCSPGDVNDLVAKTEWALSHSERMQEMGSEARAEFVSKYTADVNHQMLMSVYEAALRSATPSSSSVPSRARSAAEEITAQQ